MGVLFIKYRPIIYNKALPETYENHHPYDQYLKLANLGEGAYGQVLLVKKKSNHKLYAMKVVKKEAVSGNAKMIEAALLEKKILMKSNCPFIVKLVQSFQTQKKLYIIMQYMPNGDLYSVLQKVKKFDEHTSRFIIAEVVLGIQYLHEKQQSMYRDLKPENILISQNGHIKLADFGLAKEFANEKEKENALLVTPYYLAPEVVQKQPYDKNIDLWTLGVLTYELLCGLPPFGLQGSKTLYEEIVRNQPIYTYPFFSEQSLDFIKKLLQNDPQQRLGSKGFDSLKKHPFFEKINWEKLAKRQIEAPLCKYLSKKKMERQYRLKSIYETPKGDCQKSIIFEGFTYNLDPLLKE
ncbi:protein kinase domain protein [Ichthyophthirius multifiliis]|uniref:Protein kinase domain protein n=1 Tax=Ichthyophthirius multifiliis TaxID=5932 RepID=G0QRG6_ICHMU|nr:protein kinase domain protein [Ichthyophthirius multifiliis]EGR32201.1 protein kinase domain protein [Ichthyophthirius multifiliis]|eukprot:XP_004035687.1 protein kinase domain protein [Ichthyophthirius multifiliis]